MDAKKCDRCGGFYTEDQLKEFDHIAHNSNKCTRQYVYIRDKHRQNDIPIDLCPTCTAKFDDFIKMRNIL